jgi:hypothetical protein
VVCPHALGIFLGDEHGAEVGTLAINGIKENHQIFAPELLSVKVMTENVHFSGAKSRD